MDTLEKIYTLSFINGNKSKIVGVFDSKEAIYEAIQVRFNFIGEKLPIENEDYKIEEFQFNIIDD